ncbi:unnamed protein product [Clonostachys solani]|uniref:FAD-binding domain-containing protein n=1 Tax=Clonostachys solani TaxID=160281 RepID=A0A9P0ESX6_9HYPO|nr:unnamed protein product [Clonostachys solani]
MESKTRCKIIIAGGGVHGLTLANMLEQLDIDYVLLEARDHPTPAAGFGIGIVPNGLRILDQLGLYEGVKAIPRAWLGRTSLHDSDGTEITSVGDLAQHYKRRFGYPVFFFDRHWLLELLYNNLKHKDKVLVNKAVRHVSLISGGIEVETSDGQVYTGTLLVGADGVHSRVREEMHRLAEDTEPGYFSQHDNPERLSSCSYACSFGISQNVDHLRNDGIIAVVGTHWTQLHVPGPDKKDYFFFFIRLPKTLYGSDIKKYTKKDEEEVFEKYSKLPVCEHVVLGDVFSKRLNSTLTPLHEYVREKWFFDRIIVLGDACHKIRAFVGEADSSTQNNPITAQGGNNAIESAAEFINGLVKVRDSRPDGLDELSDGDIETIFQYAQSARRGRANDTTNSAHIGQALVATEFSPATLLLRKWVAPVVSDELILNFFSIVVPGAARLHHLPVPKYRHAIPYDDEVPGKPFSRRTFLSGFLLFAGIMMLLIWNSPGAWPIVSDPQSWVGQTAVSLVSALIVPIPGHDLASGVHLVYFSAQFISPILIYTIEGYRLGHRATFISLPFVILAATQIWGIWFTIPVYAILHGLQCHWYCTGRFIKPEVAKSLVPSLILGYIVPTILMFTLDDGIAPQALAAFWQVGPPLVPILTRLISSLILWHIRSGCSEEAKTEKEKDDEYERYSDEDVPYLNIAYAFTFAIQAIVHATVCAFVLTRPEFNFSSIFFSTSNLISNNGYTTEATTLFLGHAMGISAFAVFLHCMYAIWILRARGYVVTREAVEAVMLVTLGQVLVGPGATWTGLWCWRESVFAGLNSK